MANAGGGVGEDGVGMRGEEEEEVTMIADDAQVGEGIVQPRGIHHYHHPKLVMSSSKAQTILLTKMRDASTCTSEFVQCSQRLMRILAEDALAELPCCGGSDIICEEEDLYGDQKDESDSLLSMVLTPCNITYTGIVHHPTLSAGLLTTCNKKMTTTASSSSSSSHSNISNVTAVSIMRSGDCLVEAIRAIEPGIHVGKIFIQRSEVNTKRKKTTTCHTHLYTKLPHDIAHHQVLLCDPMLATGGSALTALRILCREHHVPSSNIVFVNVLCCPEGLEALARAYPDVKVVSCVMDAALNDQQFIIPGLGDFGDRYYGTT